MMNRRTAHSYGFTLIEVIAAMLASTVLIVGLAAAVMISTNLLQSPPNHSQAWQDRQIADRLATDLRYSTSMTESPEDGFQVTKPRIDGNSETADYEVSMSGLTRRVGSGPVMQLDPAAPSYQSYVDGVSAPTYSASSSKTVRVRSVRTAETTTTSSSLTIDTPPGSRTGDLILICISGKTPDSLSLSPNGWQTSQVAVIDDISLVVAYRIYDASWTSSTISATPDAALSAAMFAIENANTTTPIPWSNSRGGYAWSFFSTTHPTPFETTTYTEGQLNLQIFAAEYDPWSSRTFGMAGFTGIARTVASPNSWSYRNSIGVVARNGATPSMTTTPRLLHQNSGFWLQVAIQVEPAQ
ncbi:MAG: hypothetical protein AB8B91_11190 [Rubripirellula sp.]